MQRPRVTIRRLMIVIAIAAVSMTVGERAWRHYREQKAVQTRLLIKQKIIRTLGPAAAPQGDWVRKR